MKFFRFALCLGLMFTANTCYAQMYTVNDLGSLGSAWSEGFGINDSGQVVGGSVMAVP